MKKDIKVLLQLFLFSVSFYCSFVWAQSDPGALSLSSSGDSTNGQTWSGDSQYIHKKVKKRSRALASDVPSPTPALFPLDPSINRLPIPEGSPATAPPVVAPASTPAPPPTFATKVKDAVLGGDEDLLQNYKSFLDDQDVRKNIFEATLGSGYMYNSSSSSYYFKNYNDSGPTIDLNADIWLSPFLGVSAEYKSTLLNEISDSPTQNQFVSSTQSWFDIGFKFRRFFGMALSSPALTVGLRYLQYQMSIPQSSLSRAKLTNQGPELNVDLALPVGRYSFWTLGLTLEPLDSLAEASGATVRAGQSNQTIGFGASTGAEYRFSRQTTAFIKLSTTLYKSDFSGAANTSDPVTGNIPSNVPVTNMFYFLDLGIRLGY
jgi:hypothetical protein